MDKTAGESISKFSFSGFSMVLFVVSGGFASGFLETLEKY